MTLSEQPSYQDLMDQATVDGTHPDKVLHEQVQRILLLKGHIRDGLKRLGVTLEGEEGSNPITTKTFEQLLRERKEWGREEEEAIETKAQGFVQAMDQYCEAYQTLSRMIQQSPSYQRTDFEKYIAAQLGFEQLDRMLHRAMEQVFDISNSDPETSIDFAERLANFLKKENMTSLVKSLWQQEAKSEGVADIQSPVLTQAEITELARQINDGMGLRLNEAFLQSLAQEHLSQLLVYAISGRAEEARKVYTQKAIHEKNFNVSWEEFLMERMRQEAADLRVYVEDINDGTVGVQFGHRSLETVGAMNHDQTTKGRNKADAAMVIRPDGDKPGMVFIGSASTSNNFLDKQAKTCFTQVIAALLAAKEGIIRKHQGAPEVGYKDYRVKFVGLYNRQSYGPEALLELLGQTGHATRGRHNSKSDEEIAKIAVEANVQERLNAFRRLPLLGFFAEPISNARMGNPDPAQLFDAELEFHLMGVDTLDFYKATRPVDKNDSDNKQTNVDRWALALTQEAQNLVSHMSDSLHDIRQSRNDPKAGAKNGGLKKDWGDPLLKTLAGFIENYPQNFASAQSPEAQEAMAKLLVDTHRLLSVYAKEMSTVDTSRIVSVLRAYDLHRIGDGGATLKVLETPQWQNSLLDKIQTYAEDERSLSIRANIEVKPYKAFESKEEKVQVNTKHILLEAMKALANPVPGDEEIRKELMLKFDKFLERAEKSFGEHLKGKALRGDLTGLDDWHKKRLARIQASSDAYMEKMMTEMRVNICQNKSVMISKHEPSSFLHDLRSVSKYDQAGKASYQGYLVESLMYDLERGRPWHDDYVDYFDAEAFPENIVKSYKELVKTTLDFFSRGQTYDTYMSIFKVKYRFDLSDSIPFQKDSTAVGRRAFIVKYLNLVSEIEETKNPLLCERGILEMNALLEKRHRLHNKKDREIVGVPRRPMKP